MREHIKKIKDIQKDLNESKEDLAVSNGSDQGNVIGLIIFRVPTKI
jgi:hypothetical protein